MPLAAFFLLFECDRAEMPEELTAVFTWKLRRLNERISRMRSSHIADIARLPCDLVAFPAAVRVRIPLNRLEDVR